MLQMAGKNTSRKKLKLGENFSPWKGLCDDDG
jgi:hypothetical protein